MSVATVVAGLCALDIHNLDRDSTVAALARSAGVRRWLDGIDVALTARLVELSETTTPSLFPEQAVAEATRTGTRNGTKLVGRAKTVAASPEIGAALDTGAIAGAHVDVMTAALANLEPAQRATLTAAGRELAALAAASTPDQFGAPLLPGFARSKPMMGSPACNARNVTSDCEPGLITKPG